MFGGKKQRLQENLDSLWDRLVGPTGVLPNFDDSKPLEYNPNWSDDINQISELLDGAQIPRKNQVNLATSFWAYAMRWLQMAASIEDDRYLSTPAARESTMRDLESFFDVCRRNGGELMGDKKQIKNWVFRAA